MWMYTVALKNTSAAWIQFDNIEKTAQGNVARLEMCDYPPRLEPDAELRNSYAESLVQPRGTDLRPITVMLRYFGVDALGKSLSVNVPVTLSPGAGKRLPGAPREALPPVRSLESLEVLAGRWIGHVSIDKFDIPMVLNVEASGLFEAAYGTPEYNRFSGFLSSREGRIFFAPGRCGALSSGLLTLHEGGAKRILAGAVHAHYSISELPASFLSLLTQPRTGTLRLEYAPVAQSAPVPGTFVTRGTPTAGNNSSGWLSMLHG